MQGQGVMQGNGTIVDPGHYGCRKAAKYIWYSQIIFKNTGPMYFYEFTKYFRVYF